MSDQDEARTERDSLRGALSNVLCNAMNYPAPADIHLLGKDMSTVIDKATDAVLAWQRSRVPETTGRRARSRR